MTLESLLRVGPKRILPLLATLSLGCATAAPYDGNQGQGGNAGSQEGGAASFGGMGGNGGSEEVCLPNNALICHEEDVYWQDSCGELGQVKEECSEKQLCDNGKCVYDCSMVTPTSGCIEDNCAFYDSFENDLCKWNVNAGAPYVSGAASEEKLVIEGNAIIEAKGLNILSPDCNGDFMAQYKAELLNTGQGSLKVSHRNFDPNFSGITLTHYSASNDGEIILDCNGYELAVVGGYDLHNQKKLEVRKIGNKLELYVDDVYATKVACNGTTDPTPVYAMIISAGSAVLPQAMNIDDVTLYCSSN